MGARTLDSAERRRDCRPCDRGAGTHGKGRILRQGNKNPEVQIFNYVTEGTFDTIMWETVERKVRFIAQLKTGNTDARTAADVGGGDLGNAAAATKAIATGDTRYIEQVQLDDEVKRLTAMARAHWTRKPATPPSGGR